MEMLALTLTGEWDPRPGSHLSESEIASRCARDARDAWRNPAWALDRRPVPRIEGGSDVLIKVHRVGIARSNLKMSQADADGYVMLPYSMRLPIVPGHEVAGEVVEIGPAVRKCQVGELVTMDAIRPCGNCRACELLLPNHCSESGFAGLTLDGGMAEYVSVPERHVHSLAQLAGKFGFEKALDIGVVCEPAAVAYVGMFHRAGGFFPGARVAIFGCGPIGLAAIALARAAGAAGIVAFDRVPERLQLGEDMGADHVFDVDELAAVGSSPAEAILEASGGQGVDFAVEATGDAESFFPEIEKVLALKAKILSLGVERKPMPIRLLPYQQMGGQITGLIGHLGGFAPLITLHEAGRLDLSKMIQARYSLVEGKEALAFAARFREAKTVIHPQSIDA